MEKNMKRNESIEMKRILDILRSKKILIALILIVFIVLGSVYSYHYVVPKYKSTSTLLLIPNTISEDKTVTNLELMVNSELINTYSNIAKNPKVLRQTIDNLGLDMSEKQLLSSMEVNILENTYIIEISVSNIDPQKAMEITKELSNIFLNEIKEIYNLNNIGIVDEAELPEQPYNVNHIKDIILFLVMGSMASFACIMIIYIFDNTLKQEEDIEDYIDVKNLGSIPVHNNKKQEVIDREDAKSYITECINTIRTNILYMNAAKNAKTILITSCTPQEGKSWVSANIAASFAKVNKKVLLIDADMRKGRADKIFKVSNTKGLSNYLHNMTGNVKKDIILGRKYIKETQIQNLHILTNGTVPPNPSELLGSNNMKELITLLKNVYDVIVVDAPPCKLVTDSIVLSTIIDSTILVANAEKTKINDLNEVKKSIEGVGGEIIGAILNKKKVKQKTYSESYHYGNSTQREIEKVQQKEIVSVDKVIKRAIIKLEKTGFNILPEEKEVSNKVEEEDIPSIEKDKHQEEMKKMIKKQNQYLAKTVNALSEKLTKEEMKEIIKREISSLQESEQEKLTKGQVRKIIRREILNLKDMEQEKLTKEQVESIIKQEVSNINYTQDIQKMLEQEIMKVDYADQIVEINDILTNLKDSYLELSNKIKTNNEEVQEINDVDDKNNRNIIDFKALRKQKNKKKKSYSIEDDILYEELERTATYVVPLEEKEEKKDSDSSEEDYQNTMP